MTTPKQSFMDARVNFYHPAPVWTAPCVYCFTESRLMQGLVVEVRDKAPVGPGKIPDYWLTVQGETGKEMDVSVVENLVNVIN